MTIEQRLKALQEKLRADPHDCSGYAISDLIDCVLELAARPELPIAEPIKGVCPECGADNWSPTIRGDVWCHECAVVTVPAGELKGK